jgi:exodeoxyribonuclease VII small subunit
MAHETTPTDFEEALQALEAVVQRLEQGDLPLEESIKQFETGMALVRACQTTLKQAEQKIEILTTRGDREVVEPFEPEIKADDQD